MSLQDRRIWLATRGGDRAPYYQADLVAALKDAGARSVEVVGVEGIFLSAAVDLGSRAGEWLESAAGRLVRGLRIDRLLGQKGPSAAETPSGEPGSQAEPQGPDLVLVDDPRLLPALRLAPGFREADPLVVALIDDFVVETRWRGAAVEAVVVPDEGLGQAYRSASSGAKLVVAGPPMGLAYASDLGPAEAREALGFEAEQPIVLVSAGHMDPDTLDRVVFQLTLLDHPPAVLFDHGGSPERAHLLREASASYGLQARMFGEVEGLAPTYAAADLILTAADDPAVPELLLSWRPMVLVGPDRGAARAPFLADHGALLYVEDVVELGTHLDTLVASKTVGAGFVERAKTLVSRQGTADVVEALGRLWSEREASRAKPAEEPEPAPEAGGPLVVPKTPSRFETIGVAPSHAKVRPSRPAPISASEAKDQMASLIIKEREAERSLAEAVRSRDRWLDRLDLAKEYDDAELAGVAAEQLRLASAQVARINGQIETLRRAKQKLKDRVSRSQAPAFSAPGASEPRPPTGSPPAYDIDARFRRMEIERDLARLRRKLDEDGGS